MLRPCIDIEHEFEELPLFGGFTDWRQDTWTYAAQASGTATVRVYRESWEVIEVQMDTHRRGTGSEPYWVSSKAYLPSDHPLFKLVKGALEGPRADAVDASIAEDRVKSGRAA